MGKRIMVTRCGYVNVAGDVTDAEALEYVRRHLSPNDFDWEAQSLEALEVVEDVDDIECPYSATGTRSNQRKAVFVRLHRIRQGVESEIFDDDFIFFVPGDTRNVKLYAMEKFKKAAYAILTSRRAPILLRSLGTDVFNWGDFVAALDPTTESEFNFFHVVHVPQSAEFLRKKGTETVPVIVEQDSPLFPMDAHICELFTEKGEVPLGRAYADLSTGAVYPVLTNIPSHLYIRFVGGCGDKIPVAKSKEDVKKSTNLFFFLAHIH